MSHVLTVLEKWTICVYHAILKNFGICKMAAVNVIKTLSSLIINVSALNTSSTRMNVIVFLNLLWIRLWKMRDL